MPLPDDWQKPNPPQLRDPVRNAREAAEALFKPKQQVTAETSNGSEPESKIHRKPRIIPIAPAEPQRRAVTDEHHVSRRR
jgi:hypothetical protein